jgi:hypothetical protein
MLDSHLARKFLGFFVTAYKTVDLGNAQKEIFEFIEIDYNLIRIHSALTYKSPAKFESYILLTTQLYCSAKDNHLSTGV